MSEYRVRFIDPQLSPIFVLATVLMNIGILLTVVYSSRYLHIEKFAQSHPANASAYSGKSELPTRELDAML